MFNLFQFLNSAEFEAPMHGNLLQAGLLNNTEMVTNNLINSSLEVQYILLGLSRLYYCRIFIVFINEFVHPWETAE